MLKNYSYLIGWQLKFCILFVTNSRAIRINTVKVYKARLKFTELLMITQVYAVATEMELAYRV